MRAVQGLVTYRVGLLAGAIHSWRIWRVHGRPFVQASGPLRSEFGYIRRRLVAREWRVVRMVLTPWRAECNTCWRRVGSGMTETGALRHHYRLHLSAPELTDGAD